MHVAMQPHIQAIVNGYFDKFRDAGALPTIHKQNR